MTKTSNQPGSRPKRARRDVVVAAACGAFVAGMVGAAYAAVPFYNWFCRTTGFAGTPRIAESAPAPGQALGRKMLVRFDANVTGGLPWRFEPEKSQIEVRLGQVVTAVYKVTNESAREITGQASYNVTPTTVGTYFTKINCFCFTEQTMKPGETREMSVVFYVDSSLAKDADQAGTNTITLSYTFWPVANPVKPVAQSESPSNGRI